MRKFWVLLALAVFPSVMAFGETPFICYPQTKYSHPSVPSPKLIPNRYPYESKYYSQVTPKPNSYGHEPKWKVNEPKWKVSEPKWEVSKPKWEVKEDHKDEYEENRWNKYKGQCDYKKANYVEPYCYKFMFPELNFEEAREMCMSQGGDLWVPKLSDPYLFNKLAEYFPNVFGAKHNTVWMGMKLISKRFITLKGEDESNTYLGLMGDSEAKDGSCVVAYLKGAVHLQCVNCTLKSDFVCEIPLHDETEKIFPPFRG